MMESLVLKNYTSGNYYLDYDEYIKKTTFDKLLEKYPTKKITDTIRTKHNDLLQKVYKKNIKISIEYLINIIHTILKHLYNIDKDDDKILITQLIMASIVDKTEYKNLYELVEVKNFIHNYSYHLIQSYLDLHSGTIIYFREIDRDFSKQTFETHLLYKKLKMELQKNKLVLNEKNIVIISFHLYSKIVNFFYKIEDRINIIQYSLIRYIVSKTIIKNSYQLINFVRETLPTILELHFKSKKTTLSGFLRNLFCLN